jgi:hypothetical protein
VRLPSPEEASEAVCHLVDDGRDVYGIGTEPITNPGHAPPEMSYGQVAN